MLHNDKLQDLYISSNTYSVRIVKCKKLGWAGHVTRIGEARNIHKILVGIPLRQHSLGKSGSRSGGNITMGGS